MSIRTMPIRNFAHYKFFTGGILPINTLTRHFYPTALKGCQGIVFTHGVRMGGWAAGNSLSGVTRDNDSPLFLTPLL